MAPLPTNSAKNALKGERGLSIELSGITGEENGHVIRPLMANK